MKFAYYVRTIKYRKMQDDEKKHGKEPQTKTTNL